MTNIIIGLFETLGVGDPRILGIRYKSAVRYLLKSFASIVLPLYYHLTANAENNKLNHSSLIENGNYLIVSLTSFPARIKYVWQAVETILRQSYKPDKIIIWLSKIQFPGGEKDLPQNILSLKHRGLEIRFVDGDIRSHKKYFYVFNEYPNATVITLDDDLYYKSTLIESLVKAHKRHPNAVISNYGFGIKFGEDGNVLPYKNWIRIIERIGSSRELFFGSGGGTLFPPHTLHSDVTNIEKAIKLCPIADDIWLNAMCQLNEVEIVKISEYKILLEIQNKKDRKLCTSNVYGGENDKQIGNVRNAYTNASLFQKKVIKEY